MHRPSTTTGRDKSLSSWMRVEAQTLTHTHTIGRHTRISDLTDPRVSRSNLAAALRAATIANHAAWHSGGRDPSFKWSCKACNAFGGHHLTPVCIYGRVRLCGYELLNRLVLHTSTARCETCVGTIRFTALDMMPHFLSAGNMTGAYEHKYKISLSKIYNIRSP